MKSNLIQVEKIHSKKLSFPAHLHLNITNFCNLKCNFCLMGKQQNLQFIGINSIKKIVEEAERYQLLNVTLSGGEPLLHPNFNEIPALLKRCTSKISLVTNGTLLDQVNKEVLQQIDSISVSLRGDEDKDNEITQSKSFATIVNNLKYIRSNFPKMVIAINYTFYEENCNISSIDSVAKICHDLNLQLSFARIIRKGYGNEKNTDLYLLVKTINSIRTKYNIKCNISNCIPSCVSNIQDNELFHGCSALLASLAIDCDGSVKICGTSNVAVGNIQKESLLDIWNDLENRYKVKIPDRCDSCSKISICKGGCKVEGECNQEFLYSNDFLVNENIKELITRLRSQNPYIVPKYKLLRDYGDSIEVLINPIKILKGNEKYIIRQLRRRLKYKDLEQIMLKNLGLVDFELAIDFLLKESLIRIV